MVNIYDEVANLLNETFHYRPRILKSSIFSTVDLFEQTGSVNGKPRSRRPQTATTSEKSSEVLPTYEENPHTSVRKVAQKLK